MPYAIRILHAADWHLAKRLHDLPLLQEQSTVVGQVLGHVLQERPNPVVIAANVFDVAVPSVEGLAVWALALDRLVELELPTFVLPGNHDEGERLGHLAKTSSRAGIQVRVQLTDATRR